MSSKAIGQVYWAYMEYQQNPEQGKVRPVVILDQNEIEGTILVAVMEITSQTPTSPPGNYDDLKVPIVNWKEANLKRFSYGLMNAVSIIEPSYLLDENYIGEVSQKDLESLQYYANLYEQNKMNTSSF